MFCYFERLDKIKTAAHRKWLPEVYGLKIGSRYLQSCLFYVFTINAENICHTAIGPLGDPRPHAASDVKDRLGMYEPLYERYHHRGRFP